MSRRRPFHRKQQKQTDDFRHILDEFTLAGIKQSKEKVELLLRYHWDFYCDLAIQRSQVLPAIKESLAAAAIKNFKFDHWQRVLRYKWSLLPLSSKGSLSDPGGRFNIGDIDSTRFPPFSALYVAQDKETGVQEVIGPLKTDSQLTAHEYALAEPTSLTNVSVSGFLESVVDVRNKHSLKPFVDIIKKFEIPNDLIQMARDLEIAEPSLIATVEQLIAALYDSGWRTSSMQLDIPSAPQIFGQLVMEAGVEGIIYPSKYTDKACLAIFPRNFEKSESFVQLDDTPPLDMVIRRLDASNWQSL